MSLTTGIAPVAVKSATGVLTAAGVWSGVTVVLTIVVLAVVAYIRILPRLKELEINNSAGLRKEFIDEMGALRRDVKDLRNENDLLRKEIRELHGVIDGLRRANQAAQISGQRVVADALASLPSGPAAQSQGEV